MKFLLLLFVFIFNTTSGFSQTTKWKIIWDKNPEKDIKEYIVYKNDKEHARVMSPDTVYADTKIEPGILYSYRIRAVNEKNILSDYSDPATAAIPKFENLPSTFGISKNRTIQLFLKNYINDPDDTSHEIIRKNIPADSKITLELKSGNLIFKANENWNEDDIETVEIEVIDSNQFSGIAKIIIKDTSLVEKIITKPAQELNINIYPKDFSLDHFSELRISNIPQNSNISIYDSFGTLVFSEKNISHSFEWGAENNDGYLVLFGLYNMVIYDKMNNILFEGSFRVIP